MQNVCTTDGCELKTLRFPIMGTSVSEDWRHTEDNKYGEEQAKIVSHKKVVYLKFLKQ